MTIALPLISGSTRPGRFSTQSITLTGALTLTFDAPGSGQTRVKSNILEVTGSASTAYPVTLPTPSSVNTGAFLSIKGKTGGFYLKDSSGNVIAYVSPGAVVDVECINSVWVVCSTSTLSGSSMWTGVPNLGSGNTTTHQFFDDFEKSLIGATSWVVTEDDAADTQAVSDAQHGEMVLTCKATTDDDACQIQWAQETFLLTAGKRMWFEAKVKIVPADVTNVDFFVGLCQKEDLTGVADNHPATGIGFFKTDGATAIKLCSSDGGTDTDSAASLATLVTNTYITLGWFFDGGASGTGTITPYVNGVAGTPIVCTYAAATEMSAILMVRNGDNVTQQIMKADYVKAVAER